MQALTPSIGSGWHFMVIPQLGSLQSSELRQGEYSCLQAVLSVSASPIAYDRETEF